jgi:hypothetical protein
MTAVGTLTDVRIPPSLAAIQDVGQLIRPNTINEGVYEGALSPFCQGPFRI